MKTKMLQLADLFSVPEMGLLCNVAEYFERHGIDYHPEILFRDVKVIYLSYLLMNRVSQKEWARGIGEFIRLKVLHSVRLKLCCCVFSIFNNFIFYRMQFKVPTLLCTKLWPKMLLNILNTMIIYGNILTTQHHMARNCFQ